MKIAVIHVLMSISFSLSIYSCGNTTVDSDRTHASKKNQRTIDDVEKTFSQDSLIITYKGCHPVFSYVSIGLLHIGSDSSIYMPSNYRECGYAWTIPASLLKGTFQLSLDVLGNVVWDSLFSLNNEKDSISILYQSHHTQNLENLLFSDDSWCSNDLEFQFIYSTGGGPKTIEIDYFRDAQILVSEEDTLNIDRDEFEKLLRQTHLKNKKFDRQHFDSKNMLLTYSTGGQALVIKKEGNICVIYNGIQIQEKANLIDDLLVVFSTFSK